MVGAWQISPRAGIIESARLYEAEKCDATETASASEEGI